ncbi:MAG: 3-oxoacyl-ACP reductase FabG [Gammaproteobacteria bacterium]|nr:3-oxoacyl-ACP reductase FabG [Gammaproteobacteria bacterium]
MSDSARRCALVTGASRGIGQAILMHLARSGFDVAGTATSAAGAAAIEEHLKAQGATGRAYVLSVHDDESVQSLLDAMKADGFVPLVLVNNAGITRDNLLLRMSEDEWGVVLDTNVTALFRLCKPLLRGMTKARWGRIINLSSVVARMGNAGQTNYAASKAAIEGFSRALAQEVGSRNITVNVVAPGFITTEMTDALADAQREQMLSRIPLGRLGTVDDVASLVVFLAGDGASYVTGETVHVNGGLYMA